MRKACLIVAAIVMGLSCFIAGSMANATEYSVSRVWPTALDLKTGDSLYVEIAYRSDQPVTVRAEGLRNGTLATGGQRMSILISYPAGEQTAVAWLAFSGEAEIDALQLKLPSSRNELVAVVPLTRRWSATAASSFSPPQWVEDHRSRERAYIDTMAREWSDSGSAVWGLLIGGAMMLAVPGYLLLQWLSMRSLGGRWKIAAAVPLAVMVPIGAFTMFALAAGSNLWPLLLIFTAPVGCFYLGTLLIAHMLRRDFA